MEETEQLDLGNLELGSARKSERKGNYLLSRFGIALKAKFKANTPAANFNDIGKSFHETDNRIVELKNFFADLKQQV